LGTNRWILVVEDNEDDERPARRTLQQAGRTESMVVARDGEEALKALRTQPAPKLVLLDLKLPRLSGMEVLTAVREDERLASIPIVVLTSSGEQTDIAACYGLGCNAFVQKAIEYDEYVRELTATLEFWLDINAPPPIAPPLMALA
jgi:CheY-like chemotaxis protein